jgi:hypothetical protein
MAYRAEQQMKVKQQLMKLDYVIRNALEINQIIDKTMSTPQRPVILYSNV